MNEVKEFPQTIRRLPRYYQVLETLYERGIEYITSAEIAPAFHKKPSQVREDVSRFGVKGLASKGYRVEALRKRIARLLGIDRGFSVILIGTEGFGPAFIESKAFDSCGLVFQGVFDTEPKPAHPFVYGHPIQDLAGVATFIKTHHTDMAILAVNSQAAQSTAELLRNTGIRAIWNLTNADIDTDPHVLTESVNILDSFRILNYRMILLEKEISR